MALGLSDRLFGCLLGQAVGDALGFPVEGRPPQLCAVYVEEVLRAGRAGSVRAEPFPFGQYTDDTQLARELVISYVERGGFDPADYASRIAAIFVEGRIVGRGRATETAAHRLAAGVPWHEAGTPPPNAGNGSAMRAGPVGVLFGRVADELRQVAIDQGRMTHADTRAVAASVAIAGAVALASLPGPVEPMAFVEELAARSGGIDDRFSTPLRRLPAWLRLPPQAAAAEIAVAGLDPGEGTRWAGISPFATASVLWSLYSFLRTPDDYWETILTAIAVGGDVDTTAAMAGAIAGARLGPAAVPAAIAELVEDQGTWGAADLERLAHAAGAVIDAPGRSTS